MNAAPQPKRLYGSALANKISSSPKWFAKTVFSVTMWPKQEEIVKSIFNHKRVAVRGCVSSTKTFAAAIATLAWLWGHPRNSRVLHLAPSFRQVEKNMWGYIKQLNDRAKSNGVDLGATIYKEPRLELGPGWEYTGFSTDKPSGVHGIHGPNDLIILDDAHGIPQNMMDELENMFAGGNTRMLMLYNPVVLQGETYNCSHSQAAMWHNIKVSFEDLKAAYALGYEIPGALTQETVDFWRKKFGANSSFCLPKIDAEYPHEEKDQIIPLSWVEAAKGREVPQHKPGEEWLGHDVARFGDDESTLCVIEGRRQVPIEAWVGARTTENAGKVTAEMRRRGLPQERCAVDVIGIGSGVVDGLHANDLDVIAVNVSEASSILDEVGKPKFANLRSQIWWGAREALDPTNPDALALDPFDTQLHGELSAVKWKFDAQGRIKVESKEDMKKRIGCSPDRADAFCLAVYARGGFKSSANSSWAGWV